jgi:hypothetical protein
MDHTESTIPFVSIALAAICADPAENSAFQPVHWCTGCCLAMAVSEERQNGPFFLFISNSSITIFQSSVLRSEIPKQKEHNSYTNEA